MSRRKNVGVTDRLAPRAMLSALRRWGRAALRGAASSDEAQSRAKDAALAAPDPETHPHAEAAPEAPAPEPAAPQAVEDVAALRIAVADWRRYALAVEDELDEMLAEQRRSLTVHQEIVLGAEPPGAVVPSVDGGRTLVLRSSPVGPSVTVVVPVYNEAAMTLACLRSIADTMPSRIAVDVVVVDDASPEAVTAVLGDVPGLTLLRNGENLGFLRTCNRAARLASSKYLVFLNNDTLVRPGWLEALVETAERDPRVAIVGAKLVYEDGTLQEAGGIIWRDASGWNYGRGGRADDPWYEYVRDVDYCSGAALLVRRDFFERAGGFDERYAPAYFEDSDLCFAARRSGLRVVYQPRSVVVHLEGRTSGTDVGSGVKRHQVLNQPKFREKWKDVLETQHLPHDAALGPVAARRLQGAHRLLMIDNYVPEPDRDSGSNKIVHIIRLLRQLGYHVVFLPENYHASQPYTNDLQQLGVEVLYHIDGGRPQVEALREALDRVDVVWIGRPDLFQKFGPVLDEHPELPIVYDTHDLHYVRLKREAELFGDGSDEAEAKWRTMKIAELEIGRRADVMLTVTEIEKETLEGEGLDNVIVFPNVHVPRVTAREFTSTRGLIFIGGYNHGPNVDAAAWLVEEIMPVVWDRLPGVEVTLLGSNPPPAVWELTRGRHVHVTGYIHDVAPYFEAARLFVAPLRYGAGLKGKIGQSLEFGLPVVTTSVGAEGFDFVDGEEALIADTAASFADAVVCAYTDEELWQRLSRSSARKLAPFAPDAASARLVRILEAARRRRASRALSKV